MNPEIQEYVERNIIPLYDRFDKAHRRDHVRMVQHLREKYGRGGYLHLWFEHSPNAERLETLRQIIDDENLLKQKFEEYYGM